ncbi:MAG: pilus assembly protein PilW [Methylophaga sp.]|nr:MAG: pilus assembly protein PilW [Methylophaga sp.]
MIQLAKKQQGLTLIELMIAVLLGIFITGGMIQLFANSHQSYRIQENSSRLQENGRFAMNFITRDIRMSSYWGCLKDGEDNTTNNLDPAGTNYNVNFHGFAQGVSGSNGATDTITLRGAFSNGLSVVTPYAATVSGNIKVSAGNNLADEDIVIVADCSHADIFQIIGDPSTGTITHTIDNSYEPGNANIADPSCTAPAQCLSRIYRSDAAIHKVSTITYSIQNDAATGQPTLFRRIDTTSEPLIEGIEDMQIIYGEDTDDDGVPNYYLPAGSAGLDFDNVVSVRVSLLVATLEDNLTTQAVPYTIFGVTTTPADRKLRRVFTSTIAVRNRLP